MPAGEWMTVLEAAAQGVLEPRLAFTPHPHTHWSCPWCSTQWRMSPSTATVCFLIARAVGLVLYFTWNLPAGLASLLIELSGRTSSKNSSATLPSSSILNLLVYHRKPWLNKDMTHDRHKFFFKQHDGNSKISGSWQQRRNFTF